eukprot:TRINITY_DN2252_c0_g1_i3.p1 TRINITY_DN2252_c0_g1~~TRINITY_DN2252_c0_g1_i3.p1  ORF type:complete len:174 (-),score=33.86 TRINITY_DN2252_c0_g1_i3:7-528(-)
MCIRDSLTSGQKYFLNEDSAGYGAIQFHPDGGVLGLGTGKGEVELWDVKSMKKAVSLEGSGAVRGMSFSQNGYLMVSVEEGGILRLWDLRKKPSLQSLVLEGEGNAVNFDWSGNNVAVATSADLSVFSFVSKTQLELVKSWKEHGGAVTDAKFGASASWIASCSLDRTLKFYE